MSSYRGSSTGRPNQMVSNSSRSRSATPHHGSSRSLTSYAPSHGGSYRPGTSYPPSHRSASHSRSPSHSSSSASRAPSYAPSTFAPSCPSSTAVVPHGSSYRPSSRSGSTSGSVVPYSGSRAPTPMDMLNEAFPDGFNYVSFVMPDGTTGGIPGNGAPGGFGPPVIGSSGGYHSGSGTAGGYRSGTGSGYRTGPPASYGAGKSPAPSTALIPRKPTQPPAANPNPQLGGVKCCPHVPNRLRQADKQTILCPDCNDHFNRLAGSKMERYNGGGKSYHHRSY